MKSLIAFIAAASIILLAACDKPATTTDNNQESRPTPEPTPPPTPQPKVALVPPPEETKPTPEPVPVAPAKNLAPEGILFAVDRIKITTADGIRAVNPGTRLKIVRKTDTGYIVSDGQGEFPAEADQVTNEVATASGAAETHRAESTAAAAAAQSQTQAQMQILAAQKQQEAANQQNEARDRRIRELDARHSALVQEEANLTARIQQAQADEQRSNTATRVYGRVSTKTIDSSQRVTWQTRLAVVKEEKRKAAFELDRLRTPPPN